jgi:hypothetical protein
MAITRPPWPPKIINLISAGLFHVLTLIGFLGNRSIDGWLFDWASGLVTLTIGLLLLVTMPIMPFTEQYARERVRFTAITRTGRGRLLVSPRSRNPWTRRAAPQAPSRETLS